TRYTSSSVRMRTQIPALAREQSGEPLSDLPPGAGHGESDDGQRDHHAAHPAHHVSVVALASADPQQQYGHGEQQQRNDVLLQPQLQTAGAEFLALRYHVGQGGHGAHRELRSARSVSKRSIARAPLPVQLVRIVSSVT